MTITARILAVIALLVVGALLWFAFLASHTMRPAAPLRCCPPTRAP